MKVKTSIKAGGITVNRCETVTDAETGRLADTAAPQAAQRRPRRDWKPTHA